MPFGAIMDGVMNIPRMMHAEEMANDAQQHVTGENALSRDFNMSEAVKARDFNSAQVAAQREWETNMSNSQWQRTVKDLRGAGLNPILAATKGPGAYHGSAAAASGAASSGGTGTGGGAAQLQSKFNETTLNSAIDAQKNTEVQRGWNYSADTEQKKQATNLIMEQKKTQEQLTASARHQANILEQDEKGRRLEGGIDETQYGEIMRFINRAMRAITGGSSAIGNINK